MKKNYYKINLIYFVSLILTSIIFICGYFGFFHNDLLTTFLIQIVVMFGIPLLLYTLLISKNVKKTFSDTGFNKISAKMVILSIALGVVLYFINSFVANAFSSIITFCGYESLSSATVELNYEFLLKEFLLSAVLPGICEEFLHRGVLLIAGRKFAGTRVCLFLSSIMFGLTHLNINQFFYAAIMGLFMGLVAIYSNSIFPTMIIHFMNNFLSTYFVYGKYLNLPLATFVANIQELLLSNVFSFIIVITVGMVILICLYIYLLRQMRIEKLKFDVCKIIKSLNLSELTIEDAQSRISKANSIMNKSKNFLYCKNRKLTWLEKSFIISSLVLGFTITISSFIWGIL